MKSAYPVTWLVVNFFSTVGLLPMPQARQILWPVVPNAPEPEEAEAPEALLVLPVELLVELLALDVDVLEAALEEDVVLATAAEVVVGAAVDEARVEERVLQRLVSRFLRAMGTWSTWRFKWWPDERALTGVAPKETARTASEESATRLRSLEAIVRGGRVREGVSAGMREGTGA